MLMFQKIKTKVKYIGINIVYHDEINKCFLFLFSHILLPYFGSYYGYTDEGFGQQINLSQDSLLNFYSFMSVTVLLRI